MKAMNTNRELYLKAKETYYAGTPIMTDAEFDALETKLKSDNDAVVLNVGSFDRRSKIKHPTPMLSLSKVQADKKTGEPPYAPFRKWMLDSSAKIGVSLSEILIEFSQKLDGNAINVVYKNGTVIHALSRGDGTTGRDYLSRLMPYGQFPAEIPHTIGELGQCVFEVRCEAVIRKDTFEKKYSDKFENERNYVAGILNSEKASGEQLSEIDLIPVEIRRKSDDGAFESLDLAIVGQIGFKNYPKLERTKVSVAEMDETRFTAMFEHYSSFKEAGEYRVDGMVAKFEERWRQTLGENTHDPNWGLAVKFKPEETITEVIGFTMEMGKSGEFTPVALLKPVELDGTTVSKASAYNYNFIRSNNLNIGSLVSLVKSGDIIPQILSVINDAGNPYDVEENEICPYCGSRLVIKNGTHIHCPNDECIGITVKRFINSMNALDVFGCGEAMCEQLFNFVSTDPFYFLTAPEKTILWQLETAGLINKNLAKFVDEVKKIKSLPLETVIAMLSYEGMSNDGKTVKEVAKKIAGLRYDFKGLEKQAVNGWENGELKREELESRLSELSECGIDVVYPSEKENGTEKRIKIAMTGSPKEFGYLTKSDFVKHMENIGYSVEEVDVKKCDVLFTDDLNGNSGKMKTAISLSKEIKTYGEL